MRRHDQADGLALPAASVADLAALAGLGEPEPEPAAAPTMMSREARALITAGDGAAGLRAWKVRPRAPWPLSALRGCRVGSG